MSSEREAAWPCSAHFGDLCSPRSLGVLSATDVELARRTGLRVFVYRNVPSSFHYFHFKSSQPQEVRSGRVCDFMRAPCTPPDPANLFPEYPATKKRLKAYPTPLNEWLTSAKHCADVPLLTKFIVLGALRGVHTDDPLEADLFVVPFLGGFAERVSPQMTNALIRDQREGHGLMDALFDQLPHLNNATAARHIFLLTNSCGGCQRQPCTHCSSWMKVKPERHVDVQVALTLGPSWPTEPQFLRGHRPPPGKRWIQQVIVPPNIMEEELHPAKYIPLCRRRDMARRDAAACRPNTASKPIFAFYQGAHSFNGFRGLFMDVIHRAVFGPGQAGQDAAKRCDCARAPECCVNASSGVAYFHSGSHWLPITPLGFKATIEWMQRSRFCLCPPGDVPYNKRYFTALLAGCVPVVFSFRSQIGPSERNWWKPLKGPGQRDVDPFYKQINHSKLAVEVFVDERDQAGSIEQFLHDLRHVPDAVIEAKQRAIERVRHLLLYDMAGTREDAFTCALRQLLHMLPTRAQRESGLAPVDLKTRLD